jgi:4-amino-4-deoxy-L-arabinose transferase-like glycosyltransferase
VGGSSQPGPSSGALIAVVALGVSVRLVFLLLAGELELWADEAHYVQLAALWSRFGFYMGSPSYLWPPVYPAFLALFLGLFGEHGIAAAKVAQVLLSGVVGGTVVLLAIRVFSRRAALVAGLLWAGYLPLVAYTHLLWPETLFLSLLLPAAFLFITVLDPGSPTTRGSVRLVLVGVLLGLAALTKESALLLPVLFGVILLFTRSQGPPARRLARAAILVLAALVVLTPWTLRCRTVYGRWIVGGATVGHNLHWGVNARYVNFDYTTSGHSRAHESRLHRSLVSLLSSAQWPSADAPNVIDRSRIEVGRAREFVAAHPGFYLRSRVKRLADWVTPLSFFDRHYRLNRYRGGLNLGGVRHVLVGLSMAATMLALAGALPGLLWAISRPHHRLILAAILLTFLTSVLVVSMSRYRVPVEPLMLVLTAGFLTDRDRRPRWRSARSITVVAGWTLLVALWLLNLTEIGAELSRIV